MKRELQIVQDENFSDLEEESKAEKVTFLGEAASRGLQKGQVKKSEEPDLEVGTPRGQTFT